MLEPRLRTGRGDILHVPYTYFPDAPGGTEIYVASLITSLRKYGFDGAVAAPTRESHDASYRHDDISVHRFPIARQVRFEHSYGAPDEVAASSFRAVLARLKPHIVHFHAHTAAVSVLLTDAAHDAGAKTVFTYHTPTASCARGTMMLMGKAPCDGALEVQRCTRCVLEANGLPAALRTVLASIPQSAGNCIGSIGLAGGALTALRMSSLIGSQHDRFRALLENSDHVVATCSWVAGILRANGVSEEKLLLCRQGLAQPVIPGGRKASSDSRPSGPLRLAFFGRLDRTKGVDIVIEALRLIPHAAVVFDIYGIRQPGSESHSTLVQRAAAGDPRIVLQRALPAGDVIEAMRSCDLVVIPSRWLETGPLVALEAFSAGRPVLGAALGGIAELVVDGVNGALVEPEDPAAWAKAIERFAADRGLVAQLAAHVRPPRTMDDVAHEMAHLYDSMLATANA
jgi:glycosyltransferase involved in cell wall biosynthesis